MSSRKARVVILCEGIEDYDFARGALRKMGWGNRDFAVKLSPKGDGSGEQFVREHYAEEVREQRSRERVVLLVATDADKLSLAAREATLAAALKANGQPARGAKEQIAHFIPRRNLETWVYLYTHGPVDETTDYKYKVSAEDHADAALACGADLARLSIAPRKCPSLAKAVVESQRVRR